MAMRAKALAVMTKAPVAGQVKTRLRPALTDKAAADLARALLVDQIEHLCRLAVADLFLAFTPKEARRRMARLVPRGISLFPQEGEDLGQRMNAIFQRLGQAGHRQIVVIGGDVAPVPKDFFLTAFSFLRGANHRVVLGPGRDGGYYLVGMNRMTPQIFDSLTWSHDQVLEQTRRILQSLEIETRLLPVWFDVDTPDDLVYLHARLESDLRAKMKNTSDLIGRLNLDWDNLRTS